MSETVTRTGRGQHGGGRALVVSCGGVVREHPLPDEGIVIIGRGARADVRVDHPTLSREHAKLTLGAHVTIEDIGSRNQTRVGGRALEPGEIVLVAPGATLELGDALLVLRTGSAGEDLLASTDAALDGTPFLERTIARVARSDVPVLVSGEAGTGKSFLVARLHALSPRRDGPLLSLPCASVRHEDEVFAAAAAARGGTLVVRAPEHLSHEGQDVLGRMLSAEEGATRIVTTTTSNLPLLVDQGSFSAALFFRLAAVSVSVPPLRARLGELPMLAEAILATVAAESGRRPLLLSADAIAALGRRSWPGNVRELKNVLTQALLVGTGRVLTAAHFQTDPKDQAAGAGEGSLSSAVSEAEHRRIIEALRECHGNQTRAARLLGISRGTLISRLERYAVPRPRK